LQLGNGGASAAERRVVTVGIERSAAGVEGDRTVAGEPRQELQGATAEGEAARKVKISERLMAKVALLVTSPLIERPGGLTKIGAGTLTLSRAAAPIPARRRSTPARSR
jgi:hypothetical protein